MLHRIGFWYITALVVTVLMAGVGTAVTLNNTMVGTGGNVAGVMVGGVGHFFGAFQDGLAGGGGNNSTFNFTSNQNARPQQRAPQQRQTRPARPAPGGGQLQAARRGR